MLTRVIPHSPSYRSPVATRPPTPEKTRSHRAKAHQRSPHLAWSLAHIPIAAPFPQVPPSLRWSKNPRSSPVEVEGQHQPSQSLPTSAIAPPTVHPASAPSPQARAESTAPALGTRRPLSWSVSAPDAISAYPAISPAALAPPMLQHVQSLSCQPATLPFLSRQPAVMRLPTPLRASIEHLSGISLAGVQVHAHSAHPGRVQALASTQGIQIHLGPGQERHLAHEAWHVVQQRQGRVKPTEQINGIAINSEKHLEEEAERMGRQATALATPSRIMCIDYAFSKRGK